MSVRVRFHFAFEATTLNTQTSVLHVKSMQLGNDEDIFIFPPHRQIAEYHEELLKLPSAKSARKALTARGHYRRPYVNLPAEVAKLYIDSDGNPVFDGLMLDILEITLQYHEEIL